MQKTEEAILRQKSRVQWLQLGDQNYTFFHRALKIRHARNHVSVLYNDQGQKLESIADIKEEAVRYFQALLGTLDGNVRTTCAKLKGIIQKQLKPNQIASLSAEVSAEEIKNAVVLYSC